MARKKTAEAGEETPAEQKQEAQPEPTTAPSEPPPNGEPRKKPTVSYRLMSDRTTSVEVAVWANEVTYQDGNKGTQYSVTLSRSYKGEQGWTKGGSWRIHDLPCLLFLLNKAHAFALNMRTEDTSIPF